MSSEKKCASMFSKVGSKEVLVVKFSQSLFFKLILKKTLTKNGKIG